VIVVHVVDLCLSKLLLFRSIRCLLLRLLFNYDVLVVRCCRCQCLLLKVLLLVVVAVAVAFAVAAVADDVVCNVAGRCCKCCNCCVCMFVVCNALLLSCFWLCSCL